MTEFIDLTERRNLRDAEATARHGNAFIALAAQLRGAGGDVEDIIKAMIMASACLLVDAAEPAEARRMAEGVARAYPGMIETLIESHRRRTES
jgi:hypothetical protein